ncbi:hypothetical protein Tco_0624144 [Tanacetum coccineum]|uniref:Uncharacterized protein n=1 Tax=Tanacetum coccineum TaxID=301880 RepID=A0ABQ4WD58_9ASTR
MSDDVLPSHRLAAPAGVRGKICSIMLSPDIPGVLNKLAISKTFRKCSIASSVLFPEKVLSQSDIVPAFIEGINVMDCNGCDIFPVLKLPFGISERIKHLCVATPSHD